MDKSKIIDYIISEWAMRSPDGLAGGYDTDENLSTLEEIMLMEYGMSGYEFDMLLETLDEIGRPYDPKFLTKNADGEVVFGGKFKHPKYPPGTKLADVLAGKKRIMNWAKYNKLQTTKALSDKEREERINKNKYEDFAAPNGKRAGSVGARWIEKAVASTGEEGERFYNAYDTMEMDQAIASYSNGQYDRIIDAIEGSGKEKKGLGRGELFFVWLMKGYKSGGTAEVDLVFGSVEKDIEMKELTGKSKKDVVSISAPTLKGYYNTRFRIGIDELATEIRKSGNSGITAESPDSYDFEKNPSLATFLVRVLETYPGPSEGDRAKMLRSLVNFCSLLRTTEMPTNLFNALAEIGVKLGSVSSSKTQPPPEPETPRTAKAVIVVAGEKEEFAIDPNDAKKEIDAIVNNQKPDLTLKVKSSVEKKTQKDYEGEAKTLIYFKEKYTVDKISQELRKLLKNKYSGLIVIDKRAGNKARFVSADSEFMFLNLGLNKINFVLPETTAPSDFSED
jgi:hypothetical protein